MVWIKFYDKEREENPKIWKIYLPTQNDVRLIVNKLTRHFKLRPVDVVFRKRCHNGGTCWSRSREISFHPTVVSFGTICHELGHQFHYDQTGKRGHTKKLMTRIRRLQRYCEKMNYWGYA